MGFDCIWLDLEHRGFSLETATNLIGRARVGSADIIARPGKGEFARMARLLEAGAHGIMYPRCENAAEASEVVRWARFAPLGERGFDGGNADNAFGAFPPEQYVARANRETFIAVQVESPAAVEHARAMADVDGVDLLFFGPGDFSVLSGLPGRVDAPPVLRAMEQTSAAARQGGKRFGSLAFSVKQARRLLDMGATFVACGCDLVLLRGCYRQMQEEYSKLGFQFGDA
jgi:4-hydroxy-2-oxoheptanedioate aldolase